MAINQALRRLPLFTLFTGMSLSFGLMVPSIYDWVDKGEIRSRYPKMENAAMITIVVSLLIAACIWFWNKPGADSVKGESNGESNGEKTNRDDSPIDRVQFSIRQIMIAMTVVAVIFAVAPLVKLPSPILSWIMIAVLISIFAWTLFQRASVRSRMGATLVGLFLPFAWIVPYSKPFGHTSGLLTAILFGPGIIPAAILRRGNIDDSIWFAVLFVLIELGIGMWLARRGGKLAFAFCCFVIMFSCFSSLGFHALYRM